MDKTVYGHLGTGNNTDQFYSNGAALNQSQLNRISFFSGGLGTNSFVGTGYQILGGEFANQVIPVPEPETYATALLLAGIGGYILLKRRKSPLTKLESPSAPPSASPRPRLSTPRFRAMPHALRATSSDLCKTLFRKF